MFSLTGKCRKLDLPIDIQIKLFNSLVKPIVSYGAEVWGSQNTYLCDQLQLCFLKIILGLRQNTPTVKVCGETSVDVKSRVLCYWYKLVNISDNSRICKVMYDLMLKMYVDGSYKHHWIDFIKTTLDNLGLSFIFSQQGDVNMGLNQFKSLINQHLKDQPWTFAISAEKLCVTGPVCPVISVHITRQDATPAVIAASNTAGRKTWPNMLRIATGSPQPPMT